MQREQEPLRKEFQTWIFNDAGKKFTIDKRKNVFVFKVHNIFSGEFYESQEVELNRINDSTIRAAFDPKVPTVTCNFLFLEEDEWLQKEGNSAVLDFIVKIEYLSSEFRETIELQKVKMTLEKRKKLELSELSKEIEKIEEMIEWQSNSKERNLVLNTPAHTSSASDFFTFTLEQGRYLLSFTGYYILQKLYNGEYPEYDDQSGEVINPSNLSYNRPLLIEIDIGSEKNITLKSTMPDFKDCYEYPYSLMTMIEVDKEKTVKVIAKEEGGEVLMMNQNVLTVSVIGENERE